MADNINAHYFGKAFLNHCVYVFASGVTCHNMSNGPERSGALSTRERTDRGGRNVTGGSCSYRGWGTWRGSSGLRVSAFLGQMEENRRQHLFSCLRVKQWGVLLLVPVTVTTGFTFGLGQRPQCSRGDLARKHTHTHTHAIPDMFSSQVWFWV